MRELLLTYPEIRAIIRPVLMFIILEILQEERTVAPRKPRP